MGEYYKKVVGGKYYKNEESKKFHNDCDHHYYYEKDDKDHEKECDCCCVPGLVEKLEKLNGRFVKITTTGGYFLGQVVFCGDECDTVELVPTIPGLFPVTISICEITSIIDFSGLSTTELTAYLAALLIDVMAPDPGNANPTTPGPTPSTAF